MAANCIIMSYIYLKIKKEGEISPSFSKHAPSYELSEKKRIISSSVRQYGGIDHFSATGTLPCVKRPHEIVKFFCKHAAFTLGTIHHATPPHVVSCNNRVVREVQNACQIFKDVRP